MKWFQVVYLGISKSLVLFRRTNDPFGQGIPRKYKWQVENPMVNYKKVLPNITISNYAKYSAVNKF